jgi:hypothetical protein
VDGGDQPGHDDASVTAAAVRAATKSPKKVFFKSAYIFGIIELFKVTMHQPQS